MFILTNYLLFGKGLFFINEKIKTFYLLPKFKISFILKVVLLIQKSKNKTQKDGGEK